MKANSSLKNIVNKDDWYPSALGGYLQLAKYFVILGGLFFFFPTGTQSDDSDVSVTGYMMPPDWSDGAHDNLWHLICLSGPSKHQLVAS